MSDTRFKKGCIPWNKGKRGMHHTEEAKRKIGIASKGRAVSEETRHKRSEVMKRWRPTQIGFSHSKETKRKIGDANRGKKRTEVEKQKMSEIRKGVPHSDEHKLRIRATANKGELHHNWRGGVSFEPYCPKFNNKFKESIRDMFGRCCFLCNISESEQMVSQKERGKQECKLSVHHVSYDKTCLCEDVKCAFVPLCHSCHTKTGINRSYWEELITHKLKEWKEPNPPHPF